MHRDSILLNPNLLASSTFHDHGDFFSLGPRWVEPEQEKQDGNDHSRKCLENLHASAIEIFQRHW